MFQRPILMSRNPQPLVQPVPIALRAARWVTVAVYLLLITLLLLVAPIREAEGVAPLPAPARTL
ncbi:hypothetical protein [Paracoccus sp. J56]|uniref:hypothetical protein n=1 Tax=Paracoccus sp. J56 TaxID=935850 RepID=UPI000A0AC75A|nr:hypothetical protein [Paracoccus sp. J56]SMG38590.1 hypothetical protein SAMN02746000_02318 [Paracoccus sp. J56]